MFQRIPMRKISRAMSKKVLVEKVMVSTNCPTQRALDGWYAPRFIDVPVSYKSFPFLSLVLASRR
jgi:hypothetical protein